MKLIIYGAGGHAAVVIEVAQLCGFEIEYLIDDDPSKQGREIYGIPVIKPEELKNKLKNSALFLAIGDNKKRRVKAETLQSYSPLYPLLIHPKAIVSPSVEIGEGTVIMAGALVNPYAKIGRHCIINTGAVVEHHCSLGDFVHIAPNATLGGAVQIGQGTLVGLSATVLLGKRIGENCTIGAGAMVLNDVPSGATVVGVPARFIRKECEK